jgi:uncharacterized caspase-like protein
MTPMIPAATVGGRARLLALGLWLLASAALAPAAGAVPAERRVALVIGNGAYRNAPELVNPTNDARAMAALLRDLDFEVLEGEDLEREAMEDLIVRFEEAARAADVALAFYAGHGVQVGGRNFLLPVEARLEQRVDLRRLVPADWLIEDAGLAGRLALVILDACRDNPLVRTLQAKERSLGVGHGLALAQDLPANMLVAYATGANATAADGTGANSPFTEALLENLRTPGLEVGLAFRRVRDSVVTLTGGNQQPATYGSLGGQEFYLAPELAAKPAPTQVADAGPASTGPAADYGGRDRLAFDAIRDGRRAQDFAIFLERFPESALAPFAVSRLEELEAAGKAAAPAGKPASPAEREQELRLGRDDWQRLQLGLTALGHDTRGADGRPGPATRLAITAWQVVEGHDVPTGYLTKLQRDLILLEGQRSLAAWARPTLSRRP